MSKLEHLDNFPTNDYNNILLEYENLINKDFSLISNSGLLQSIVGEPGDYLFTLNGEKIYYENITSILDNEINLWSYYINNFITIIDYSITGHGFLNFHYIINIVNLNFLHLPIFTVILYLFGIFVGFIVDIIFYYIGKLIRSFIIFISNVLKLSFLKKINFTHKNFFYIILRILPIPIISNFSVLIGSILDNNHETKKDLKKIFIGNVGFVAINILYGFIFI